MTLLLLQDISARLRTIGVRYRLYISELISKMMIVKGGEKK